MGESYFWLFTTWGAASRGASSTRRSWFCLHGKVCVEAAWLGIWVSFPWPATQRLGKRESEICWLLGGQAFPARATGAAPLFWQVAWLTPCAHSAADFCAEHHFAEPALSLEGGIVLTGDASEECLAKSCFVKALKRCWVYFHSHQPGIINFRN